MSQYEFDVTSRDVRKAVFQMLKGGKTLSAQHVMFHLPGSYDLRWATVRSMVRENEIIKTYDRTGEEFLQMP